MGSIDFVDIKKRSGVLIKRECARTRKGVDVYPPKMFLLQRGRKGLQIRRDDVRFYQ